MFGYRLDPSRVDEGELESRMVGCAPVGVEEHLSLRDRRKGLKKFIWGEEIGV